MVKYKKEKGGKKTRKRKTKSRVQKQIEHQNKLLRNFFMGLGIVIVIILLIFLMVRSMNTFEYQDIKFKMVREGSLLLYQTSLPVIYKGEKATYNFYLRNDPRNLEEIPFNGEIKFLPTMVIDATDDFSCDGDGVIAVANLVKLYEIAGTKVIKNESIDCSPFGDYMFVEIREGSKTKIMQPVSSCYVLTVNNCEILKVTERFMLETFAELNELI